MQIATRSPNEEEILEGRSFLGTLAGASLGVLSEGIFTEFAEAQNPSSADQISLETSQVEVSGNTIFVRRYGKGPAILLVHGFPRTSLTWRFLAPKLAENHTVVCVDLRAYGRSGIPASTDDHFPYSKRAMAKELVEVMDKLGFPTFTLIGHDRGGHVSYRLALDHPKSVERLAVFDVTPIRGHPTMRKMCALQAKAEDSTPLKRDPKCATRNDKIDPNPQLSPSSHTGDRHSPFQLSSSAKRPTSELGDRERRSTATGRRSLCLFFIRFISQSIRLPISSAHPMRSGRSSSNWTGLTSLFLWRREVLQQFRHRFVQLLHIFIRISTRIERLCCRAAPQQLL